MFTVRRASTRLQVIKTSFQHVNPYCLRRPPVRSFGTDRRSNEPTALNEELSPNRDIYLSASTDPYFNLTLEDWLFRHAPESRPLLLIYRDSPCVVIGRNQNPWTEVNFPALRAAGIPFIRRRSGGGTVYHDLGNTNFSIHMPRTTFDRHATGRLVLRAVRSLGIDAHLNDRNDVCIGPNKMRSAYKIVNRRAYHHGTMLITTELSALGDFLRPQKSSIVTKGVASVRSPVCNLQKYATNSIHSSFTAAVVAEFRKEFGITTGACTVPDNENTRNVGYIRKGIAELSTWDWAFGQTPEFTHTLNYPFPWGEAVVKIRSKHGIIVDCSLHVYDADIRNTTMELLSRQIRDLLLGKRYGFLQDIVRQAPGKDGIPGSFSSAGNNSQSLHDLWTWIEEATSVMHNGLPSPLKQV